MPKIKTHKGAQRRFHITGGGNIMRAKIGKSHLRLNKPKRVKRLYGGTTQVVSPVDKARIRKLIPYGIK